MEQNKSSSFYFQKAKKNRRSHANLKRNVTFQEDQESPNDEIPLPMTQTRKLNRKHRTGSNPDYNVPFKDLDLSPRHNKDTVEKQQDQSLLSPQPQQKNDTQTQNITSDNNFTSREMEPLPHSSSAAALFQPKDQLTAENIEMLEQYKALEEFTQQVLEIKGQGVDYFEKQLYQAAADSFQTVLDSFKQLNDTFNNPELVFKSNILYIYKEAQLNLALCQIRQNNYEHAIDILTSLLHYEAENPKAFYLRAKAAQAIRDYDLALKDFKAAKKLRPSEAVLFDHHIIELEITIQNISKSEKQDDLLLTKVDYSSESQKKTTQMDNSKQVIPVTIQANNGDKKAFLVVKEKRGGVVNEVTQNKDIEEILNYKKPRTFHSLFKMIFSLLKYHALSMNAVALALVVAFLYHYLLKRKLFLKSVFYVLDRVA